MNKLKELSPRERRQQRTSQAILDAARQIIQREGIDALSMRAIAERIDYSPATLYEYYAGKDEIVQAVCDQGHELMRRRMAEVDVTLPVRTYLVEIGLVYIGFAVSNPDYFRLMFAVLGIDPHAPPQGESASSGSAASGSTVSGSDNAKPPLSAPPEDSSFYILLQAIQRGIGEGVYKTRPGFGLLEMAYGAWSLVHGMASLRIAHDSRFPVDYATVERALLYRFAAGLAADNADDPAM